MKRGIAHEPAYVLHRYDWSESSLILEVFTRNHGRVAVVAKGAKRPSSNFRPILLPLQPLQIAFGGDAEIRTLKGADWAGGHVMPTGNALLSGYYLNELLMRLLARDDSHAALFDAYAGAVQVLAGASRVTDAASDEQTPAIQSASLRAFELILLREIGLLPVLDMETPTLAPLVEGELYSLRAEGGLALASDGDDALSASQWMDLQAALDDEAPFTATLRACVGLGAPLRKQLRALLHYHCGVSTLRTRQLMADIQSL